MNYFYFFCLFQINTVKALLKPGGIKKNLKYILSVDIVNEYNIDGVHGKLCLKDLKNFYDVVIGKNYIN